MKRHQIAALIVGATALLAPAGASAATIPVTTNGDEYNTGPLCSLREAVQTTNTDAAFGGCAPDGQFTSDPDEIEVPSNTYALDEIGCGESDVGTDNACEDIDVLAAVVIRNTGDDPVQLDGSESFRVLDLQADGTTLSGLTIERGFEDFGGGMRNGRDTLIENSTIRSNTASLGNGGGIYTAGTADLTLENVTISGNKAAGSGGGMTTAGTSATLRGVTVTGNTADFDGSGSPGDDGGGIAAGVPTILRGALIAGNTDGSPTSEAPDCIDLSVPPAENKFSSDGTNLIGTTTGCNYPAGTGDVLDQDPGLGALADNGGTSFTHALSVGSPAVNQGSTEQRPTDQRGALRQDRPDVGAYELHACGGIEATLLGTNGRNTLIGTPGVDAIVAFSGNDVIRALGGGDKVCAGGGRDKARGGGGRDLLRGEAGKDRLFGQGGRDRLIGGPGADILRGGPGRDVLSGGPGRDRRKQ